MTPPAETAAVREESNRADAIYRTLWDAITEQALVPGTRLPEDVIGERFGVSRTVVRSALNRLQADRLVEQKRNRGAFVASPTQAESRQVFEARRFVEREIALALGAVMAPAQIALLEAHVAKERDARDRGDERLSIKLSGQFHTLIAEMHGNEVLRAFLSELVSRTSLILALYGRPHVADCSVAEHEQIIAAFRAGDGQAVAQVMQQHLAEVEARADLTPARSAPTDVRDVLGRYAAKA
jgi:DNA-binding GntR family transcriptional regulator